MKKNTLEAMRNYLNGDETVDLATLTEEVNAEWNRLNAKRDENKKLYEDAHTPAFKVLSSTPRTVKELFAMTDEWPEKFSQSKLQYAFLRYWDGEVKVNRDITPHTYWI